MTKQAPILETERLVLRGHRIEDHAPSFAMWSDPATVEHITGTPSTWPESWSRILRYAGLWSLLGFGYWAVEERSTGGFIGEVGFGDFRRMIEPSLDGVPEIGWVLDRAFHGKGYATEAVRAALLWADRHVCAPSTACIISPDNLPSLRLAHRCGYEELTRTAYQESQVILMRRARMPR